MRQIWSSVNSKILPNCNINAIALHVMGDFLQWATAEARLIGE